MSLSTISVTLNAPRPDATQVAQILCSWVNSDVKAEPLKTAQGLICAAVSAVVPCTGNFQRRTAGGVG
jgi:hypothetical protein